MGVEFKRTDVRKRRREAAGKTAAALLFVNIAETSDSFDATTLAEHADLFDRWVEGIQYTAGQIRIDESDGCLYRCTEAHKAKKASRPSATAQTVWTFICNPAEQWPEWFPSIGRTDSWMKGDKCSHGGKRWVSREDYNVREPGVGGWDEVN